MVTPAMLFLAYACLHEYVDLNLACIRGLDVRLCMRLLTQNTMAQSSDLTIDTADLAIGSNNPAVQDSCASDPLITATTLPWFEAPLNPEGRSERPCSRKHKGTNEVSTNLRGIWGKTTLLV